MKHITPQVISYKENKNLQYPLTPVDCYVPKIRIDKNYLKAMGRTFYRQKTKCTPNWYLRSIITRYEKKPF